MGGGEDRPQPWSHGMHGAYDNNNLPSVYSARYIGITKANNYNQTTYEQCESWRLSSQGKLDYG